MPNRSNQNCCHYKSTALQNLLSVYEVSASWFNGVSILSALDVKVGGICSNVGVHTEVQSHRSSFIISGGKCPLSCPVVQF